MEPRILVVDDDALIRRIMRDTLSALPATVLEATNGEEAVKTAKAERPDLIFLDTMMPGMDGFQTAEALKQDPATAGLPLVFVSALGTSSHKVRGLDIGAEDYISKPIDPEELKARVRSILRRTRPAPAAPEPAAAVARGQLQTMPLPSLIHWLELERRTARLLLTREQLEGEIHFREGEISSAVQGARQGDAAVYQLLTWTEGAFNIMPGGPPPGPASAVSLPNDKLLLEGERRLTELPGLRSPLPGPDTMLELPVALCAAVQAQLPPAGAALLGLLDGTRSLDGVLEGSPLDAWTTLQVVHRLLALGALGWSARGAAGSPRRSIPRVPMGGLLQYQALLPAQQVQQFTLSARGVFIQTPTPLSAGEQVLLQFQFPGTPAKVTAIGQVIWRKGEAEKARPEDFGMGLQFLEASPETLEAIEQRLTQGLAAEIRGALGQP